MTVSDIDPGNGPDTTPDNKGDGDPGNEVENPFKAITTQEEFNAAIQGRVTRLKNQYEKKYEGFEDFKQKAEAFDKLEAEKGSDIEKLTRRAEKAERDFAEIQSKFAAAERNATVRDIADELGLPKALVKRVQGDTEEDIRADIEDLLQGLPSTKKDETPKGNDSKNEPPSQQPKARMTFAATGDQSDQGLEISADDVLKDIPRGGGAR